MEGKIGGDSLLSPQGLKYADALPDLITDNIGDAPLTVIFFFLEAVFACLIPNHRFGHRLLGVRSRPAQSFLIQS